MVLPAPVWPTTAMVSPGSMREADVAQHPVFVLVGEPDVVEFDGGGSAGQGRGLSGRQDLARRVEQLEDALGRRPWRACRMLYFSLRSWIGRKKRRPYWKKATSTPSDQRRLRMRKPP